MPACSSLKLLWRHVGADDTLVRIMQMRSSGVRGRVSKFTVREIHAQPRHPLRTVTCGAVCEEQPFALHDVGGRGFVLGDERRDDQDQSGQPHQGRRTQATCLLISSPRSEYCV